MPPQPPIRLDIGRDALPAVTFALQRTIDDLEARAIVVADRDVDLGPSSAAEYRTDIDRLAGLLGKLGHRVARPNPERAAIVWDDGTYTIEDGRPVRLTTTADLNRLFEQAIERRRDGRLTPSVLIELVAEATGSDPIASSTRSSSSSMLPRSTPAHTSVCRTKVAVVSTR